MHFASCSCLLSRTMNISVCLRMRGPCRVCNAAHGDSTGLRVEPRRTVPGRETAGVLKEPKVPGYPLQNGTIFIRRRWKHRLRAGPAYNDPLISHPLALEDFEP